MSKTNRNVLEEVYNETKKNLKGQIIKPMKIRELEFLESKNMKAY